jgi:hypothetical protein
MGFLAGYPDGSQGGYPIGYYSGNPDGYFAEHPPDYSVYLGGYPLPLPRVACEGWSELIVSNNQQQQQQQKQQQQQQQNMLNASMLQHQKLFDGEQTHQRVCLLIIFLKKPRPIDSRLKPDYLADFLPEKIWRTFYNEVLPDFLAYYFAHSVK